MGVESGGEREKDKATCWCPENAAGVELAEPQGPTRKNPPNGPQLAKRSLSHLPISPMNQTPPTPPATQTPHQAPGWTLEGANSHRAHPKKHPKFYCTDLSLTDGVIIRVCWRSVSFCPIITPMQAENTLYRLSFHGLARGSHFFASTFSINNGGLGEGSSDEHPIVLPETITCDAFEAYLWYDIRLVDFNWYRIYAHWIFMQI